MQQNCTIDNLLRCSICYEFFDVAMIIPECSHNYCSLCIRRSLSYEPQCPTCSSKVSPPSLKTNRVLDELVKNFIKVRTKLLELATTNAQKTSLKDDAKKRGETKNKRSSTAHTRRRKAQSTPQNDSKSSSPDTKRQRLDAENEQVSNPVEVTLNDELENPVSTAEPEVAVVDEEENQQEQQQSELQPTAVDECRSENETPAQPSDADFAECPVCGDMVPHRKINSHLDACLTRTEKKSSLRSRKKASESKTSKSSKRKCPSDAEFQESPPGSSDDSASCSVIQEACSSTASSSTLTIKGSNALIRTIQKRKPLPKLVYSVMAEKELRQRLKEWNLSTKGDKSTLVKRHQDFVMLYNAQCDSPTPMTAAQIAREVEKAEKTRAKEASSTSEASTSGLHFEKDQSEEDMDKTRQKYLNEHQDDFNKLIADIQKRQRGKRKKSAAKTSVSESLDRKKVDTAEEDFKKSENNESGDPKHSDDQEKNESTEKSEATVETYLPFFRESDHGSSQHEQCKTSSVIPEPPLSPSLASLEEEDENTPSLGLEDDDWEFQEDKSGDPNVIPESPVIKVGRATDATADTETPLSESDEEFQQNQTFVNNKRVKSNLF
ncbi:E3 ubiquitin-protein ligase RAD18-like isoform X3 [Orbicella faveolata]|uniref:E3 ubiquitin-protein ligase RAD18-like isoform X3 n=1 Tax=Orbicella faveolata TaxID=48498 RepID=UPI0009E57058|nr:E3 ubiquitin-protein ligase RAD18-like isoform X3 [Orbicella faveolata]